MRQLEVLVRVHVRVVRIWPGRRTGVGGIGLAIPVSVQPRVSRMQQAEWMADGGWWMVDSVDGGWWMVDVVDGG